MRGIPTQTNTHYAFMACVRAWCPALCFNYLIWFFTTNPWDITFPFHRNDRWTSEGKYEDLLWLIVWGMWFDLQSPDPQEP